MHGRLATRLDSIVGCGAITVEVIMHKTLSLIFEAADTIEFQTTMSSLCTDSSLYSISCLVPLPAKLLVKLAIAENI